MGEDAGFVEIVLTISPAPTDTEFLRSVLFSTADGTATGKRALLGSEASHQGIAEQLTFSHGEIRNQWRGEGF